MVDFKNIDQYVAYNILCALKDGKIDAKEAKQFGLTTEQTNYLNSAFTVGNSLELGEYKLEKDGYGANQNIRITFSSQKQEKKDDDTGTIKLPIIYGEYYHSMSGGIEDLIKNSSQGTEAGKKALELDAADGKQDGKISAKVWNAYAKKHGGKSIKNEINILDAADSITTYSVQEEIKAQKAKAKKLNNTESNSNNFGL